MNFDIFKRYHSEIVMYCQCIEHDLRLIYSYMHKADPAGNLDKLSKYTLGNLISELRKLDNSDGKPNISRDDYNFLMKMTPKRNYWCHRCFEDFIYNNNWEYSTRYSKICKQLEEEHAEFKRVSGILEEIRLELVKKYSRNN